MGLDAAEVAEAAAALDGVLRALHPARVPAPAAGGDPPPPLPPPRPDEERPGLSSRALERLGGRYRGGLFHAPLADGGRGGEEG